MEIAKKCRNVQTTRAQVSQVARGGGPWLEIKLGGSGRGAHRETERDPKEQRGVLDRLLWNRSKDKLLAESLKSLCQVGFSTGSVPS